MFRITIKLNDTYFLYHSIFSNKIWPEEEVKSNLSSPKTPTSQNSMKAVASSERSDSGIQHSGIEDENSTNWTPEIPFENVSKL